MTLTTIFTIIFVHWIADFIMQDEQWAINKSKNIEALLNHTLTYSAIWLIVGAIFSNHFTIESILFFVGITFVMHTITDYFTSRIVSRKFAKGEYGSAIPNFGAFTIIGFDQVLHYVQLFLTYQYLT